MIQLIDFAQPPLPSVHIKTPSSAAYCTVPHLRTKAMNTLRRAFFYSNESILARHFLTSPNERDNLGRVHIALTTIRGCLLHCTHQHNRRSHHSTHRHVGSCTDESVNIRFYRADESTTDAKVAQFYLATGIHKNI